MCRVTVAAICLAVTLGVCTDVAAQNPRYPGYLGVYVSEHNNGMRITGFIQDTPANALARQGDIQRNDVIMRLGGRTTPTLRQLHQARNRIPDGMEAKMIMRSRNGYVYHIWIGRNEAAAAAAMKSGGPDVPLQFEAGGRGEGKKGEDFRRKGGGAPSGSSRPSNGGGDGDFRPKR